MIITTTPDEVNIRYSFMNLFPDQFKTESYKQGKGYIKNTMDYFANVAFSQYNKKRKEISANYNLLKGIINYQDFYNTADPAVKSFVDTLMDNTLLPEHVKHYPILNPPLNTLLGELSNKPDIHRIRAFDVASQNEEIQAKTDIVQQLILQEVKQSVIRKMAMQGQDVSQLTEDEVKQMTMDEAKDELDDYTSQAESWGNHIVDSCKAEFNMKEKSEDAFRDLLVINSEYYHVFEDNSRTGFNIEVVNDKNYWALGTPDKKWSSGASGEYGTPYVNGLVNVMELSEIIETFPDITKEEIDYLHENRQDYGMPQGKPDSWHVKGSGHDTVTYDPYDPLLLQERMILESEMQRDNKDDLTEWLGLSNSTNSFGYKYTVVRAYWMGKKMIGGLKFLDEEGIPQFALVDESYETSPNEISIEWGWINQMYQGARIGHDVYLVKPFKCLDYSPIIGITHEIKNTKPKSFVDLMKSYQAIYNLAFNQTWRILEKEIGVVYNTQLRRILKPKDGDEQDAFDIFEEEARERGFVIEDDSPENNRVASTNTSVSRAIDLGRANEIQSRWNLAMQVKQECWEMVGMNKQRLGASQASATATANQNDLAQSFAQTAPLFAVHDYVLNQLYQAIVDISQYIQGTKPESTISYITAEGESAFLRVNGPDIKLRDLKVFSVSRPEDQRAFNEIRQLSQAMLQNGASPYEVVQLYSTNSIRKMKKQFRDLKKQMDEEKQREYQLKQDELKQKQDQLNSQLKEAQDEKALDRENENFNKAEDRINKKEVALIGAYAKNTGALADIDNNGVADALEITKMTNEENKINKDYQLKNQELLRKQQEHNDKIDLEMEKLKVERAKMKNDLKIASKRPKPAKK